MASRSPIRILLVDDSEEDGLLLSAHLQAGGLSFELTRMDTLEPLRASLAGNAWDLLLTEFELPTLSGLQVLQEAKQLAPTLTCMMVSGRTGEEAAGEALRAGAKEFISKHRLARLIPAIQHELSELGSETPGEEDPHQVVATVVDISDRKKIEGLLEERNDRFLNLANRILWHIAHVNANTLRFEFVNEAFANLFTIPMNKIVGRHLREVIGEKSFESAMDFIGEVKSGRSVSYEGEFDLDTGKRWLQVNGSPVFNSTRQVESIAVLSHDITERRSTEDALRRSKASLQSILASAAAGILAVGNQREILHVNGRFADIWGIPQHLLDSGNDKALLDYVLCQLTDPQAFLGKVEALYNSDQEDVDTLVFNDGRIIERYSVPMMLEGSVTGRVWSFRDITAQKALEQDLSKNIQFLRILIETLPNPLYYEDREGHILGCNLAFQEFLGLPAHQILGKHPKDLLPEAETKSQEVPEHGSSEGLDLREGSFTRTLPDGRVQHVTLRKAPFFQADGELAGYVASFLDFTKIKETEQALRHNESLFSMINQYVIDLIAIIDNNGDRLYSSPSYCSVLGYSELEMAAHSPWDLLHPNDTQRVSTAIRGLRKGHPIRNLEVRLHHKDGRWLHFESTVALIPNTDAGVATALMVARNVTEQKEAEQSRSVMEGQLRQSQKLEAIGQLAAGIAHEINTPTQYIGDNATFLRDSFDEAFSIVGRLRALLLEIQAMGGDAGEAAGKGLKALAETDLEYLETEIPKAIQQSLDGVGRISEIVTAMKNFSHPGGEAKTLTDLHQAIESTITVSRNEWKYAANLVTDFDPDLPPVPCYPGEFNQVILNLIVNAAHAIKSAKGGQDSVILGQITVKTRAFADAVEVSVSDDGTGIPEAVQARMFEPFYTTKPLGKGSGQGLAIAHAVIVEKHQGRIDVQSEVGKGTTFTIRIPLNGNGAAKEDAK